MMRLTQIPQTVRNLNRLREIVQVIAKHGFGDLITRLGLDTVVHSLSFRFRRQEPPRHRTEVRIRMLIEDLGATFIKLGQILATRPDLIPMSLIKELRLLQDRVKPVEIDQVRALLEAELGRPPEEVFAEFNERPLAAASIGQVHRAQLRSGEQVVLKVQRPGLESQIETDLSIMHWIAKSLQENIPELRRYDPVGIVAQFEISLTKEIDFRREASHIQRFARNFEGDKSIYVPKVYTELSTSKVLVEEFIRGLKADSEEVTQRPLEQRARIASNGIHCCLSQVFVHGFFHGDPHPGNIFIVDDDRFCFIDYGMMGILDEERIDEILSFLVSALARDPEGVVRLFDKLGLIPETVNERALRTDLLDLLERYGALDLKRLDIGVMLTDIFDVIARHDITVPSDLLLVGKALATIDGVARAIYPELEPLETIRPKIIEIYLRRISDPKRLLRAPRRALSSTLELLQSAPKDLRMTMRKLNRGELQINTRLADFQHLALVYDRAQNRVMLGTIIAGLAIASSILLAMPDSPPLYEIFISPGQMLVRTLLGLVFFALTLVYGLVLIFGFFRSDGV
jgi:ubiquinone biosynthesis protein